MHSASLGVRRVPTITFHFWAVKILTTAMGEALSDYMVHTIDPYIAVGLGGIGIVVALIVQFSVRRYIAPTYWFAVAMVAVFGTMCADAAHIVLHIPYTRSAVICAIGLAGVFTVWYLVEKTLSIHSITTWRREVFYWAAVLATFAMGTAVGDMTAYTMREFDMIFHGDAAFVAFVADVESKTPSGPAKRALRIMDFYTKQNGACRGLETRRGEEWQESMV